MDCANNLWFYSLCADTLDFLFLQFLTGKAQDQLLQDGLSGGRLPNTPVILFSSEKQEREFISELKQNPVTVEAYHGQIVGENDSMINEQDRNIIGFSEAVIKRFSEWKT